MALSNIVSSTVVSATATPKQQGFGNILCMVSKTPAGFTNRVRSYSNGTWSTAMVADGFATSDAAYLMVQAAMSQTPSPAKVKIGRRANKTVQVVKLKCLSAVQGDTYKITLVTPGGVSTTITRTVPGASSTTAEATAILALINAVTGFAGSTSATDTITIASPATAGTLNRFKNWTSNFYLTNTTADPGINADLVACLTEDNDFYGAALDSESKAEILAAAPFCESNKKLQISQNSETDCTDSTETTTNVMSQAKSAAYRYTGVLYNGNDTGAYAGVAWQANRFAGTPTPGNETWSYKTLAGVTADAANLNATQYSTVLAKNGSLYDTVAGLNTTEGGFVGSGEHIDIVRFVDWVNATIQTRCFALLMNSPKVPYTEKGAAQVGGVVQGVLNDGEKNQGLVAGQSIVIVPDVSVIDSVTKGLRLLPNVNWNGKLAGAIETMQIAGTVSL